MHNVFTECLHHSFQPTSKVEISSSSQQLSFVLKRRRLLRLKIFSKPRDIQIVHTVITTPIQIQWVSPFIFTIRIGSAIFIALLLTEFIKKSIKQGCDLGVIVCTDEALNDLPIRNMRHIIHFSLPQTWSMFQVRFLASFDYYESMVGDVSCLFECVVLIVN